MRRVALALISTIAGLSALLSFKTEVTAATGTPAAVTATGPASGATAAAGAASSTSASASTSTSTSTSTGSSATTTVTGDSINTRYGPVQVRITVQNGKLTSVTAIDYPNGNGRDQEINAQAIPTLTSETMTAGNAKIDMVSGATYTSQGYISSLQSALDKAGLS